ncbi:MAG: hypothetical protein ABSG25_06105, partial [Bryobacteraceae bacterium]
MKPKVAILNAGLHHEKAFQWAADDRNFKYVYIEKLPTTPLEKFDVLIVPFHTDQIALYRNRGKLIGFLRWGGVLVLLGATQEGSRAWIPYSSWQREYTTSLVIASENDDANMIFKDIPAEDLKFHGYYYAHGWLLPGGKFDILAYDEHKQVVMFVRRDGFRGSLLCTTLDPDFHSIAEVPGPKGHNPTDTRQKADKLLQRIVLWATEEAKQKGYFLRIVRRGFGYFANTVSTVLFWAVLILPAIVLY